MPDTKNLFTDFEQEFNQITYNKKVSINTLYQKKTQVSKTRVQINQKTIRIKVKNLQNQTANLLRNTN